MGVFEIVGRGLHHCLYWLQRLLHGFKKRAYQQATLWGDLRRDRRVDPAVR